MPIINSLKKYADGFFSLVYPHNCLLCQRELNQHDEYICFLCKEDLHFTYFEKYQEPSYSEQLFWGRLHLENVYSMLYFSQENSTQKILHEIKYHNGKELGVYMGKMMGERIFNQANYTDIDAIIPVPIHTKKEFIRGYNQSMSIATGIQKTFQVPVVNALYRKTHDASQTKKSQEQRYENVKDKFGVYTNKLQNIHHVLIVDDVLTTGATLESVVKAVLSVHLPIKISIATIAVAHT